MSSREPSSVENPAQRSLRPQEEKVPANPVPDDTLRTADGRIPGSRGRATRERLIQSTRQLLETTSYRDLSLASIARDAGASPATFYQYFEDLGAVVMVLADEMLDRGHDLVTLIEDGDWDLDTSSQTAIAFVNRFSDFWEQHRTVIRVVELLSEEGDQRFQRIRKRIVFDVTEALAAAIRKYHPESPTPFDPMGAAGALVSMLAHVATYVGELPYWHIKPSDTREYIAYTLHWTVVRRPLDRSVAAAPDQG
jgi:AcrR family transcriptional regulator